MSNAYHTINQELEAIREGIMRIGSGVYGNGIPNNADALTVIMESAEMELNRITECGIIYSSSPDVFIEFLKNQSL